MKPARFDYLRAETLAEAHEALAAEGDDARVIAGGQTLLPMLSMRLARPKLLVDIMRLPELRKIEAAARQHPHRRRRAPGRAAGLARACCATSLCSRRRCPGSAMRRRAVAAPCAARSRMPIRARRCRWCCVALGGSIELSSRRKRRSVPAAEFFTGMMSTSRDGTELIEAVSVPARRKDTGYAFHEFGRRHGDFAIVACAAVAGPDGHLPRRRRRRRPARCGAIFHRSKAARSTTRSTPLPGSSMRATICTPARLSARAGSPHRPRYDRGGPPMPRLSAERRHRIRFTLNGRPVEAASRAAHAADRFPAP